MSMASSWASDVQGSLFRLIGTKLYSFVWSELVLLTLVMKLLRQMKCLAKRIWATQISTLIRCPIQARIQGLSKGKLVARASKTRLPWLAWSASLLWSMTMEPRVRSLIRISPSFFAWTTDYQSFYDYIQLYIRVWEETYGPRYGHDIEIKAQLRYTGIQITFL